MNLQDIIALAKQGFTPKDIKELIKLGSDGSGDNPPPEEDHTEEDKHDDVNDQKGDATPGDDQVLDYKKLYEEEQQKVTDLTSQLELSQKKNTKENMQGKDGGPSDQDLINDLARSFM